MQILVINSSPRRDGNISRLLNRAVEVARRDGAAVDVINLYDMDIRPCVGCMVCRSKLMCPIKDDMPHIADAINAADSIIIGAPCYWGNMPGLLKSMFDRLVYLFISQGKGMMPTPLLKGKKAVVIATSTTPMPWARLFSQTSGTTRSITKILKMGGVKIAGTLQVGGTMRHSVDDSDFKKVDKKIKNLLK